MDGLTFVVLFFVALLFVSVILGKLAFKLSNISPNPIRRPRREEYSESGWLLWQASIVVGVGAVIFMILALI